MIREANVSDAKALSSLACSLEYFMGNEEQGITEYFRNILGEAAFTQRLQDTNAFKHFVYEEEGEIIAYISMMNTTHLYHLFIDKKYHKQGFGTLMWHYILKKYPQNSYTLNSSISAITFYEKIGFNKSATEQETKGERYQPMSLSYNREN